jgi:predicted transcriptional regulator
MIPLISEIKRRRKILGITQVQLAKLAEVSQSLIAKIESNKIDPSYSKTKAILDILSNLERREKGKAEDIMSKNIIHLSPKDMLSKVVKLMKNHDISQIPVMDGQLVVGSVSEKSILDSLASGEKITLQSLIEEVMDEPFPQLDQSVPIDLVTEVLRYNQAILLTKKGKITGIVTKSDLLKIIE